jgi:hypothetical protein
VVLTLVKSIAKRTISFFGIQIQELTHERFANCWNTLVVVLSSNKVENVLQTEFISCGTFLESQEPFYEDK